MRDISEERIEECRAEAVIKETVPEKTLAATGGPSFAGAPLVPIAALLLAGVGIFVGRTVISGRGR